ncbi:hypothetical protein EVA_11837 [gut metagenome]|uniref:Uncharacterized protein n=1 Tax=gut metagenome TaxID=749906 RepID=J9GE69_9ZZZZ
MSDSFADQRPAAAGARNIIAIFVCKLGNRVRGNTVISGKASNNHGNHGRGTSIYCNTVVSVIAVTPAFIPL